MKAIVIGVIMLILSAAGSITLNRTSSASAQSSPQLQLTAVTPQAVAINAGRYENNSALLRGETVQTSAPLPVDNNVAGMLRHLGYDYR
jgi:hypothetical protein